MQVTRKDDITSGPAPEAYFTGAVTIERLQDTSAPSRVNAVRVSFPPGARTAWHTHPLGQLLIVVEGEGWARTEGEEKHVLRPGDTVLIRPGNAIARATDSHAMVHIAVQEPSTALPPTGRTRQRTPITLPYACVRQGPRAGSVRMCKTGPRAARRHRPEQRGGCGART